MSKGPGKTQRAIAALIEANPSGAWRYEDLAERIYGTALFTRAQKGAIGRSLSRMHLPGTWAVWQASFKNDRRFWLFDPCSLESWRKIAAGSHPANLQPGGTYYGWWEEAKRQARAKGLRPPEA
jgi:hypothetical protein